jgi:hypothetical protein
MNKGVCVGHGMVLVLLGAGGCAGQASIGGLESEAAGASGQPSAHEGTAGGAANTPGDTTGASGVAERGAGGESAGSTGESTPGNVSARFDCSAVRSQQFDPDFMKVFSVSAELTDEVESTLALMGPAEKAGQMTGLDGSARN